MAFVKTPSPATSTADSSDSQAANCTCNPSGNANGTSDTVAFFMVPAKDLDEHVSELTNKGVDVLDKYTFKDLRGGQKDTGPEQTLLILGSKDSQSQLISTLQDIASTLPYN